MATTHATRELELNADCAEFCPVEGHQGILGIGTYQLVEERGERVGRLYTYRVAPEGGGGFSMEDASSVEMPGIFDMKWRQSPSPKAGGGTAIAAACADGSVRFCAVSADGDVLEVCQSECDGSGSMCLSLDWGSIDKGRLVVSNHGGGLVVLSEGEGGFDVAQGWHAHGMEAWIAAFDRWSPDVVYSGADDCTFKVWDLRAGVEQPMYSNRKEHGAGVCSMQSSPHDENVLITGSYDENVRVWDVRTLSRPLMKVKIATGGGVWRLKWHPTDRELILAACMHAGYVVLRAPSAGSEGTGEVELVERYQQHGMGTNLGYGADWYRGPHSAGGAVAATASFYDRAVHLWSCAQA